MNDQQFDVIIADNELKQQLKALVRERINIMPDNIQLEIGSQELSKQDIIYHVEEEDEIGRQMMLAELDFLRDLASGAVYSYE